MVVNSVKCRRPTKHKLASPRDASLKQPIEFTVNIISHSNRGQILICAVAQGDKTFPRNRIFGPNIWSTSNTGKQKKNEALASEGCPENEDRRPKTQNRRPPRKRRPLENEDTLENEDP